MSQSPPSRGFLRDCENSADGDGSLTALIKVDSWWRWVFWHCSYCLCKCEEVTDDSDRYWSLVPAVADTANNMVRPSTEMVYMSL